MNMSHLYPQLVVMGYTGTINDMLFAFFGGPMQTLPDRMFYWLGLQGATGTTLADRLNSYLAGKGYVGTLQDKINQWELGPTPSVYPAGRIFDLNSRDAGSIILSGAEITQWTDSVGLTQWSKNVSPGPNLVTIPGTLGGKPVADFTTVQTLQAAAGFTIPAVATVIMRSHVQAGAGTAYIFTKQGAAVGAGGQRFSTVGSDAVEYRSNAWLYNDSVASAEADVTFAAAFNASERHVYINGVDVTLNTGAVQIAALVDWIGPGGPAASGADGKTYIGRLQVYDRLLTPAEITTVHGNFVTEFS